jgi:biopolymer transport protein ExbD
MNIKHIILISFAILAFAVVSFVVTTRISTPKAFDFAVPEDHKTKAGTYNSNSVLNLLLLENGKIICYQKQFNQRQLSLPELREVLVREMENKKDLMVIIKPIEKARYKLLTDVLDEMHINNIEKYVIADLMEDELDFVQQISKQ